MSEFPKELHIPLRNPLTDKDTDTQTYGCRQLNPDICGWCFVEGVCAFSSGDCICKHPSAKWKKIYRELKEDQSEVL